MAIENHVILWAMVGMGTGTILSLTGSGGAVVTIPILMAFGGYDIKEASGYGLLSLSVGATISWLIQRENTHYPIAGIVILFASAAAFFAAPLKVISPHWLIITLLNMACVFSLYNMWVLRKFNDPGERRPLPYQLKTASMGGMLTGFFNTITGLGGGVIIIPWLTGITRLSFDRALACSLLTVAVISPVSAWRQNTINLGAGEWGALISTIILASWSVKKAITYIPPAHETMVRKLVFTGVIFITMTRTLRELL